MVSMRQFIQMKRVKERHLGRENNYKILLKKKTINSIEKLFSKEMEELGYL